MMAFLNQSGSSGEFMMDAGSFVQLLPQHTLILAIPCLAKASPHFRVWRHGWAYSGGAPDGRVSAATDAAGRFGRGAADDFCQRPRAKEPGTVEEMRRAAEDAQKERRNNEGHAPSNGSSDNRSVA